MKPVFSRIPEKWCQGARRFHLLKRMHIVALTNNPRISIKRKQIPKTCSMDPLSCSFSHYPKKRGLPVVYTICQSLTN